MELIATVVAIIGATLWGFAIAAGILIERLQDERRIVPFRDLVASGKQRVPGVRKTG